MCPHNYLKEFQLWVLESDSCSLILCTWACLCDRAGISSPGTCPSLRCPGMALPALTAPRPSCSSAQDAMHRNPFTFLCLTLTSYVRFPYIQIKLIFSCPSPYACSLPSPRPQHLPHTVLPQECTQGPQKDQSRNLSPT